MTCRIGWALLLTVNVLGYCILSLSQATTAAPPRSEQPLANPAEQRAETIVELKEIIDLLKQQNAFLRSGHLKVFVAGPEKR